MSFKSFSTTHNAPAKGTPAADAKQGPLVDHPPRRRQGASRGQAGQ